MIHLVYGYLYGEAESNASGFTDSWRYFLPCHPFTPARARASSSTGLV
jgi:hypothetical protein